MRLAIPAIEDMSHFLESDTDRCPAGERLKIWNVEHVFAVRDALASAGLRAQIAGVLHDVVEDTPTTLDDLRQIGVPEEVLRAVDSVTRRPDEPYMSLVRRATADPIGRLVKLADNRHNSDEARLALPPPDQAERLRRKYAQAREVLEAAI